MRTADVVFHQVCDLMKLGPDEQANLDHNSKQVLAFKVLIQDALDEAIAHGMTISAEINNPDSWADKPEQVAVHSVNREILTARDNKVWRKE